MQSLNSAVIAVLTYGAIYNLFGLVCRDFVKVRSNRTLQAGESIFMQLPVPGKG